MLHKILATAVLLAATAGSVSAQEPRTLTIISHNVHKTAATGGDLATAQNIAGEWAERNNVTLNWVTLDIGPLHDRRLREMSPARSSTLRCLETAGCDIWNGAAISATVASPLVN